MSRIDYRNDFDQLIVAPRKLFEEFSEKYGHGKEGEVDWGSYGLIRSLTVFGVSEDADSKGLCFGALQLSSGEHGTRLSLLWRMPQSLDEFEWGNVLCVHPLIEFFAGRDILNEYTDDVQWRQQANIHLGRGYGGFGLLMWPQYWPVINEMVVRFSELVAGFPQLCYEKREKAA